MHQNPSQCYCALVLILAIGQHQQAVGISVEQDLSLSTAQLGVLAKVNNYLKNTIIFYCNKVLKLNTFLNLLKFREKVSPLLYRDFMHHDIYLIRWLRGNYFS